MPNLKYIHSRTVQIYERHAHAWDDHRPRTFFEKGWLDKFIKLLPSEGRVLDVGCGAGEPITGYFLEQGLRVTGLDASPKMLEISKSRFPNATWIAMDMRNLKLDTKFDGIVSWDGFFHLNQEEQRQVLLLFADHLNLEGSLLLTIGHESGEVTGRVEGEEVYHSSLDPDEYKTILNSVGFENIEIKLVDESCGFHSILLAKRG
ncbi:class I SAM-dependent methyltransferase [Sedimenticola sp.]|uniref:class I SAM-dependent methyltransferase n=1 Tax=Sedimenticola sp. TaxID=1940285 RepID=UPI003D1005BA